MKCLFVSARSCTVLVDENGDYFAGKARAFRLNGEALPEIGYHIHKNYWHRGFAKEAGCAVRDWAFRNTKFDTLYSYMKYTNTASYSTAKSIGMEKRKEYADAEDGITLVYAITREKWERLKEAGEANPAEKTRTGL